jgi:hypothetical protein
MAGSYDQGENHINFERIFYRCEKPKCGTVFYFDELTGRSEDLHWEEEREQEIERVEARRQEMLDTDVYQNMIRAREESDATITKDRELVKQVKEIDVSLAKDQEELDSFMDRMRNFTWEDFPELQQWIQTNWLPPSFAEKTLALTFGMSRPTLRKDLPEEERALLMKDEGPHFEEGQTVVHQAWGKGKVIEGNTGGGTIITAEFPKQGKKKMDLRFAKLELASK